MIFSFFVVDERAVVLRSEKKKQHQKKPCLKKSHRAKKTITTKNSSRDDLNANEALKIKLVVVVGQNKRAGMERKKFIFLL